MIDTKQYTSERSPDYLAATLREVAEMLTDVGKTIDARLAAWAVPETPEPDPPSVEVIDARSGATWLFSSIDLFERWDGRWRVWGHPRSPDGYGWDGCYIATAATPFAIWQECVRKGVPCCDPPSVTLTLNIGDKWRVFAVNELRVAESGNTFIRCIGNRAEYPAKHAVENIYYVTESPAAIRADCAAAGVPCPEEEKPETVDIISANTGGIVHLRDLRPIEALIDPEHGPCLRVNGYVTKAPISDIRAQAAEAGIELPEATVRAGYEWSHIAEVQHRADGTTIFGQVAGEGIHNETNLTPAQVLALSALAGWPKPEVWMVLTYAGGSACEVDPADIQNAEYDAAFHTTCVQTRNEYMYLAHCVREPVAVVEAMRDACKPIEEVTQCHTESA